MINCFHCNAPVHPGERATPKVSWGEGAVTAVDPPFQALSCRNCGSYTVASIQPEAAEETHES